MIVAQLLCNVKRSRAGNRAEHKARRTRPGRSSASDGLTAQFGWSLVGFTPMNGLESTIDMMLQSA
jgi:hypothetical protein